MGNNLHYKVLNFVKEMQNQLDINEKIQSKGSWEQFTNVNDILVEIEYHKGKLYLALKEKDITAIKEYIADISNYLLMLGNSMQLFDQEQVNNERVEIKKNIFEHLSLYTYHNNDTSNFLENLNDKDLSDNNSFIY